MTAFILPSKPGYSDVQNNGISLIMPCHAPHRYRAFYTALQVTGSSYSPPETFDEESYCPVTLLA